jgi:hypothetical protein
MTISRINRAIALAAFGAACATPVHADSFASSASSAGSASSASISDSIGGSSNSSKDDRRVTAGEYRVIEIAQAPAKATTTRVTLRAVAAGTVREFYLDVPDRALAQHRLQAGELVKVNERMYGYEFAYADSRPFFLALQDDWYRELGSQQVTI